MSDIVIQLKKGGSIKLPGPIVFVDEEGNERVVEREVVSLCRCGGSKDKPFCDGTHRSIGFEGPGGQIVLKEKQE